jgi:hypothetical protein
MNFVASNLDSGGLGWRVVRGLVRERRGSWWRLLTVAGVVVVAVLALVTAAAQALIVQAGANAVSYLPAQPGGGAGRFDRAAGKAQLEYHGGPVMPSNTNYALYWDPSGAPGYPAGYETGIDRYFEDVAHDSGGLQNIDSLLAQYGDGGGEFASYNSHFGGPLIDSDPYPANGCAEGAICFTEEQLRAEIAGYVSAHSLPTDLKHAYFLLTPPGVESCFEAAGRECSAGTKHPRYCAYHGDISVAKGVIVYANDPYVNGLGCDTGEEHPNNSASDAAIGGGLAHEHSEAVTDPELNAWYDSKRQEVADKCRTLRASSEFGEPLGRAPDGANYNQLINGDEYLYQQVWSNGAAECEQRAAARPTVTKVAPKSGHAAGGTVVTITGANFLAPATVRFGATPATSVTVNSSKSITAVSPPGTRGVVDVTVTTPSGTSAISKKDHFKYKK